MVGEIASKFVLIGGVALCLQTGAAIATGAPAQIDKQTLAQVEALYGIDENAALTRLAKEYDAAVLARRIGEKNFPGFAGAWFDASTQGLVVATNASTDFAEIKNLGATPKLVAHSILELDAARDRVVRALQTSVGANSFRDAAVDVQTNTVQVEVVDKDFAQSSTLVQVLRLSVPVRLVPVPDTPYGFSSSVRGADPTWNNFSPQVFNPQGTLSPCSVGVSAEKITGSIYKSGFATAGHCGLIGNTILASDQVATLGSVQQTTLDYVLNPNGPGQCYAEPSLEDGAWVQTVSPWVPLSQITGYADPTIYVSGTWAGMLQAPVGTTVCRYGSSTHGPYCGQLNARNTAVSIPPKDGSSCPDIALQGMIKVHGICTEDGDSGGPLVMPVGQVQGTDTGSLDPHTCTGNHSNYFVYFQPVGTTLVTAGSMLGSPIAMLTSHGRSAPTVSSFRCPDPSNSGTYNGIHMYTCNFVDFDSQGKTDISWTTSTGASSDDVEVSGTCAVPGPMVNVTLAITNPYGTKTLNRSFSCPTKPMP